LPVRPVDVQEKVVIITGAARGIGQQFASSLAAAGALVVAADVNDPRAAWSARRPAHSDASTH
jgi:NAD(P)-dependent dehydrogenase (short-subunit alcohol dehydrogenase family)